MTGRERKDYYLDRIRRILMMRRYYHGFTVFRPKVILKKLEEELKIIMWNNSKSWTEKIMKEEVLPLLERHGIKTEGL